MTEHVHIFECVFAPPAKPVTDAGAFARGSSVLLVVSLLVSGQTVAQSRSPGAVPPPSGMSLARSTAMRFPQPVRVGDLLHRDVLQPVERQTLLGTVRAVVREPSGQIDVIVDYGGGLLGIGGRPIAVPIDATVLLGQAMEIVAYAPGQLRRFPTFSPAGTTPVDPNAMIRVGLAKPSH